MSLLCTVDQVLHDSKRVSKDIRIVLGSLVSPPAAS